MKSEYTKGECGCKVVSGFLCGNVIEYCPLHKSAPKLYEACKAGLAFIKAVKQQFKLDSDCRVIMLETTFEQAIAKVEGD